MTWWNKSILKGTESMEESVVISVEGKQKFLGEEPQTVQIVTDGIMKRVGDAMVPALKETAEGGLAATPTACRLRDELLGKDAWQ